VDAVADGLEQPTFRLFAQEKADKTSNPCQSGNMYVTRWGRKEAPLSQFPGWGVEIMMGLYGEQSVRSAIEAEKNASAGSSRLAAGADLPQPKDVDPVQQDLDAVGGMFRWLQRRRA
jgi:hypothetical protein